MTTPQKKTAKDFGVAMTDRISVYAMALQSDINTSRFQVVEDGRLQTYWMGTVYGLGVATESGFKFRTPEEAWNNASKFIEQCASIVSERLRKKGEA